MYIRSYKKFYRYTKHREESENYVFIWLKKFGHNHISPHHMYAHQFISGDIHVAHP